MQEQGTAADYIEMPHLDQPTRQCQAVVICLAHPVELTFRDQGCEAAVVYRDRCNFELSLRA